VKKAIVKSAQTNYLISDSTKYGRVASFHALDMESLDGVITDTNLPSSVIEELNDKGIEVINAPA